jgi:hypothetical protein
MQKGRAWRPALFVFPRKPAVITTAGDVPAAADMERLTKLWENVRRA